jgi:hypothetical protein
MDASDLWSARVGYLRASGVHSAAADECGSSCATATMVCFLAQPSSMVY